MASQTTEFICEKLGFSINVVREPLRVLLPPEADEDLLAHFNCQEPAAKGAISVVVRSIPLSPMLEPAHRLSFLKAVMSEQLKYWHASTSPENAEYRQDASEGEVRFEAMHPALGEIQGRIRNIVAGARLYELFCISGRDQSSVSIEGNAILDSFRLFGPVAAKFPIEQYFQQYLPNHPIPLLDDLRPTSSFGLFDTAAKHASNLTSAHKSGIFLRDTTDFLACLLIRFHGALPVEESGTDVVSLDGAMLFIRSWAEKCLRDPIGDSILMKASVFLKTTEEAQSQPIALLQSNRIEALCHALACSDAAVQLHNATLQTLKICEARETGNFTSGSLRELWCPLELSPAPVRLAALFVALKLRDYASQGMLNASGQVQGFVPQTVEALFGALDTRIAYAHFVAGLSYLQDAPVGPNGDLFKSVWKLSKKTTGVPSDEDRLAAAKLMLSLIENKGFHHDIGDFKRVLKLLPESGKNLMQEFHPKHPQRCFLAIRKLYREYPALPLETKSALVNLLDTARGSRPSAAWNKKREILKHSGYWHEVDDFARWLHLDDDLHKAPSAYGWSDSIFTRFHKAAQWILFH